MYDNFTVTRDVVRCLVFSKKHSVCDYRRLRKPANIQVKQAGNKKNTIQQLINKIVGKNNLLQL